MAILRRRLIDSIREHEGYSDVAYQDHLGTWTIGFGTNLQTLEVEEELAEAWMAGDLAEVADALEDIRGFSELDTDRQDVLIEMGYQLGIAGLLRFRRCWNALRSEDYDRAADEMLDSRWAREQTPDRAQALAARMRAGPSRNGHNP